MRYLKPFFEKFESKKLSGVINFISKESRVKFLDDVKKICGLIDYPISNLSDDNFQYLRFRDAYKLQDPTAEENGNKCPHCKGLGKTKRPWGKEGQRGFHFRELTCKFCNGTGVGKIKKADPPPTNLKFWFNTEGKYLGITRFVKTERTISTKSVTVSDNKKKKISDWEKIGPINYKELNHLDDMYIKMLDTDTDKWKWIISKMWIEGDYRYSVHNANFEGDEPENPGWEKYGKNCWGLSDNDHDFDHMVYKLTSKGAKEENKTKGELDPDYFNIPVDVNLNRSNIDAKNLTRDAEFSLILNIKNLESSEYNNVSLIKKSRLDSKSDALAYKKDDDIRKENIENYISKLSSYDPDGSLNQIKSLIPRFFGWNHPTFFLFYGINFESIMKIIESLFALRNGVNNASIVANIKSIIISSYKETSKRYATIVENFQKCKKLAMDESREDVLQFLKKYEDLNKCIVAYLGKDITRISDIEVTERKIKNVKEILKSTRYALSGDIRSFLNHLTTKEDGKCKSYDKAKQYLDIQGNKEKLIGDMDIIIETISSL